MIVEKEKFREKTGIDPDKYVSDEAIASFEENIEKSLSFLFTLLIPIIVLNIIFLTISLFIKFYYQSQILYILFFVVSLIISVLGGGTLGLHSAIKNSVAGIRGIANYSLSLFNDMYPLMKKDKNIKALSPSEVYGAISGFIVLPIVKLVLRRKLFGNIYCFFVEKIVIKSSDIIKSSIDKLTKNIQEPSVKAEATEATGNDTVETSPAKIKFIKTISQKIGGILDTAVKGILLVLKIASAFFFVIGLLALFVLVIIFNL